MALISCPECSKEISDSAKQCPNCGYKLHKNVDSNNVKGMTFLISIVLVVVLVVGAIFFVTAPKLGKEPKSICESTMNIIDLYLGGEISSDDFEERLEKLQKEADVYVETEECTNKERDALFKMQRISLIITSDTELEEIRDYLEECIR